MPNFFHKTKHVFKSYRILILIIAVYIIYFSLYTIIRNNHFYSGEFDLGNMQQTLWNTLHGHFFMESDPTRHAVVVSRFADHADLLLLAVLPFYALFTSLKTLLIVQTIAVALGAIPVFLFTRQVTQSKYLGYLFATTYLLLPGLENANVFEFHAVTMGMTSILFFFYFLWNRKYVTAIPFFILSLLAKEEVGFTLALMSLYFLYVINLTHTFKPRFNTLETKFKKNIKLNIFFLSLALFAFSYSCIMIMVVIPHFRNGPSIYLQNYENASQGISGIISYTIFHPLSILQLHGWNDIKYVGELLVPTGLLSIFSPLLSLLALPELLIDILSKNTFMQSIYFQYTSVINPIIILSSITGFVSCNNFLSLHFKQYKTKYLVILLTFTLLLSSYFFSPLALARGFKSDSLLSTKDVNEIYTLQKSIPHTAIVSASNNIAPHFSQRFEIFTYPTAKTFADYIIIENESQSPSSAYKHIYSGNSLQVYKKK